MSCTYTHQGQTFTAWEFVDYLAGLPMSDLMKYLPEKARAQVAMASAAGRKQTETPEFKKWFGKSLVTDEDGNPQVMYHGTSRDFSVFDSMASAGWRKFKSMDNIGSWFSDNPKKVDDYSGGEGKQTMPVYLRIARPKVYDSFNDFLKEMHDANGSKYEPRNAPGMVNPLPLKERLKSQGYDGIAFSKTNNQELHDSLPVLAEKLKQAKEAYGFADKKERPYYDKLIQRVRDDQSRVMQELEAVGESTEFDEQYVWVAFEPEQIKSAIGNNGQFDKSNPDIRASVDFNISDFAGRVTDSLNDTFRGDTAKTFNWWHNTVGSQFHKAKISPAFDKVFRRAQQFIEDVARYGTESADLAPSLLPKMDTFFGAMREIKNANRDSDDAKAIAASIFEGTLFEDTNGNKGKVWTDAELRSKYNLNDRQIGLYREYRAAVDHSLETMAIAEMNKVARINKLEPGSSAMTMNQLASFYTNQYIDSLADLHDELAALKTQYAEDKRLLEEAGDTSEMSRKNFHENMIKLNDQFNSKKAELLGEISSLETMNKAFKEKSETINKLKAEGYAPLTRFGKYTLDVTEQVLSIDSEGRVVIDKNTNEVMMEDKRVFFSMFESEAEARQAEKIMKEEYPDAQVTRGVASEDGWQLFGATNPGSLEMLAKLVGNEDEVVQKFYREATASRSAMKRLIHRQGIAGYSNDVTRGLASFLMSNARATASADHFGDIMEAADDIPKSMGDVKDEAVKMINYIRNPNEEAGGLRGLLFMQYLGGSIASAAVNLTQSITTTMPFLSQYGGTPADLIKAGKLATQRMAGKGADIDADLAAALQRAEIDGVVSPHNIHALMGASSAQTAPLPAWMGGNNPLVNRAWRGASHAWGSMFGMAEQFNRETAFIAMYKIANAMGAKGRQAAYDKQAKIAESRGLPPPSRADFASAYDMAKNAVNETQFVLSKAARPNWARGTVGATLFTFKQFGVMYLELFKRLPNKERAMMMGTLILLAGVGGAPGADDLDDLIDTMGQMLGYNTNTKKWKDKAAADIFGKTGGDFIMTGVSAFLPLELSTRLGMGNLIPATSLFKKSSSGKHERDYAELMGAAGGYAKQVMDAWDYTLQGRYGMAAAQSFLPKAFKDIAKAVDMATTGTYDDAHGRMVMKVDTVDALVKALGFQPSKVADIQRIKGEEMQDIALVNTVKASISEIWARGNQERKPEVSANARKMLAEWNSKNPESKITINPAAIQRRVNQMNMTAAQRMEKVAPKEMRAGVRSAFAE